MPIAAIGATAAKDRKVRKAVIQTATSASMRTNVSFPFLGFTRKMYPHFFKCAPAWLDALSGLQSILGVILLFFVGLALRNRFRIK